MLKEHLNIEDMKKSIGSLKDIKRWRIIFSVAVILLMAALMPDIIIQFASGVAPGIQSYLQNNAGNNQMNGELLAKAMAIVGLGFLASNLVMLIAVLYVVSESAKEKNLEVKGFWKSYVNFVVYELLFFIVGAFALIIGAMVLEMPLLFLVQMAGNLVGTIILLIILFIVLWIVVPTQILGPFYALMSNKGSGEAFIEAIKGSISMKGLSILIMVIIYSVGGEIVKALLNYISPYIPSPINSFLNLTLSAIVVYLVYETIIEHMAKNKRD